MKTHETEIQIARDLFTDAISQIKIKGREKRGADTLWPVQAVGEQVQNAPRRLSQK